MRLAVAGRELNESDGADGRNIRGVMKQRFWNVPIYFMLAIIADESYWLSLIS